MEALVSPELESTGLYSNTRSRWQLWGLQTLIAQATAYLGKVDGCGRFRGSHILGVIQAATMGGYYFHDPGTVRGARGDGEYSRAAAALG
jgi:hypothetical protein